MVIKDKGLLVVIVLTSTKRGCEC